MNFKMLKTSLFVLAVCSVMVTTSAENEWFGPNKQYKCHCTENKCDTHGDCLAGSKCERGWFGPSCQYMDLAAGIIGNNGPKITDGDDVTCKNINQRLFVNLYQPYIIHWIKIVLKRPTSSGDQVLTVKAKDSKNEDIIPCNNRVEYKIDNTTDIICKDVIPFDTVEIQFEGQLYLCSVYISGGRNLALKQNATQSSTFRSYDAMRAVDGNTDGYFDNGTCSHTRLYGTWTVHFEKPKTVYSIKLYNRVDSNAGRLRGFEITAFDIKNNQRYKYKDTGVNHTIYNISIRNTSNHISKLQVTVNNFLTLCEVEIYGDDYCTGNTYGLECLGRCNCTRDSELCNVYTGACSSNCVAGSNSDDCRNENAWFGPKKQYKCHCTENKCDTGGNCLAGSKCELGWFGPSCQYNDLAAHTKTDKSMDGDDRTCEYKDRVVYVASNKNSLILIPWVRIITHASSPDQTYNVMFRNSEDYCIDKTFGLECQKPCICSGVNTVCQVQTGACTCAPGFTGPNCQQVCNKTYYGDKCSNQCNTSCLNQECNNTNGLCIKCQAGRHGPMCDKVCDKQHYGINCNQTCSSQCSECESIKGDCLKCNPGYNGTKCDIGCDTHHYGINCNQTCPAACKNSECDRFNGTCLACYPGYTGAKCEHECKAKHHGDNCSQECSTSCLNETCNNTNGVCFDCLPGREGQTCERDCDDHHYGSRCVHNCSDKCNDSRCNKIDGSCLKCIPGYFGTKCEKKCNFSKFGQDCKKDCNKFCSKQGCHHEHGTCLSCVAGRTGPYCSGDCPHLSYGPNCTGTCPANCAGLGACFPVNGTCVLGCVAGYKGNTCHIPCHNGTYGANCELECSSVCVKNSTADTCNRFNGTCLNGCTRPFTHEHLECSLFWSELVSSEESSSLIPFIVPAVLLLIIVLAIAIALIRRKAKRKHNTEPGLYMANIDDSSNERKYSIDNTDAASISNNNVTNVYENNNPDQSKFSIEVNNLIEFLRTHTKQFYVDEFKQIPTPVNVTTDIGLSEDNKHKNRYKNICTYDHSRVHLEINTSKNEGDYINASYIEGFNNQEKFIASQGPNNTILNDFVRMLWEQKTEKVVMLTNLIEEGKIKCDKYWPDEGSKKYGDIKVELAATQTFADYTIRTLELKKKKHPVHTVTHFHFTSWPDQGVPLSPWGLVDFEQRVALEPTSMPIVVHCSAGVGRTGTFIALRTVLKEAEETGKINFFKTVAKLRQDRVLMIQTAGQYEFLHRTAQVALCCHETTIALHDIPARLKHLQQKTVSGQTNLEKEFYSVSAICSDLENKYKETNTEQEDTVYQNNTPESNRDKNRVVGIISKKEYRVFLSCESLSMDDYINAVFVPSFTKRESHILTQLPMPTTVIDFWKMVVQYKVSLIVAFQRDTNENDETIGQYLPANATVQLVCGPYTIHTGQVHTGNVWEELEVSIKPTSKTQGTVVHKLTHMNIPAPHLNARDLLTLTTHARSKYSCTQDKVLFMCRDGAELCGLACVLGQLLDRADHDQRVCVPLVVGSLKCVRPEVIPSVDQYRLIYEALQIYNETSATSNNFEQIKPREVKTSQEDENVYANYEVNSLQIKTIREPGHLQQ